MIRRRLADRPLAAIVVAAMLVYAAAAVALGNEVTALPGTFDQLSYDVLAQQVVAGRGFTMPADWWPYTRADAPTAHWSYVYTGYLAAIYAALGRLPLVARVLQALLVGLLLPWGVYRLGSRVADERVGLVAAAVTVVYAYFVYYAAALVTEAFTLCAVVWWLTLVIDLAERPTSRRWLALGALTAAMALLRQVTLFGALPVIVWLVHRRRASSDLAGLALAGAVGVALVLPVTVRNYRAFGRIVPINTNAGYAFFWANHPIHGTSFRSILAGEGATYQDLIPAELRHLDEAALDAALLRRGLRFVADDPVRYLRLSISRIPDYFLFWPSSASSLVSNLSRTLSFGLALPLMVLGLWWSRTRWRAWLPVYLFVAAYTLVHLLSWALVRYRLPVDAVAMPLVGLGVVRLVVERWAGASSPR